MRPSLPAAAVALNLCLLASCAARRIPGTELEDTSETRAILDVVEQYRQSVEGKDLDKLVSLLDPSFTDNAGTPTPADDVSYANVRERLAPRLEKVKDLALELTVKKIELLPEQRARAVFTYNQTFTSPDYASKPFSVSEIKQMLLRRHDGGWKIVSGI